MEELLLFFRNIDKIKHIERNGWINIGVKGTKDTIASHSFGASLLGWVLSKEANLDGNKVIKLLLIHDLIMAHIPDITPRDRSYQNKIELENEASENLLKSIPKNIKIEFQGLFKEYQEQKTEESKLAREADKLETIFQSIMYSEKLNQNKVVEFINSYEKKFKSKISKKILQDIKSIWVK